MFIHSFPFLKSICIFVLKIEARCYYTGKVNEYVI